MKSNLYKTQSTQVPIIIMVLFVVFLFFALFFRVVMADRDLASVKIAGIEASLAAESGVYLALHFVQDALNRPGAGFNQPDSLIRRAFENSPYKKWQKFGTLTGAETRISEIRNVPGVDNLNTPMLDESSLFRVETQGRQMGKTSRSLGVLSVTDLVKRFAVVNSLNEYYFGQPIQPWASESGSLVSLIAANRKLFFDMGVVTPRGFFTDSDFVHKMFSPSGSDPFTLPAGRKALGGNYGSLFYKRDGNSPCRGPLFCQTPIVVDSHQFFGPIQTSGYLFRRGNTQSTIFNGQSSLRLTSSRRIQKAEDHLEGEVPENLLIDQDSDSHPSNLSSWNPDFDSLRKFSSKEGIVINQKGEGMLRGEKTTTDYHLGKHHVFSDTYLTPVSTRYEQDKLDENFIVFSTSNQFDGKNNLSKGDLQGTKIIFSENSIFIRGEIEGDLVIATPKHIYITGNLNPQNTFKLFLIAGEGVALSTADLEDFITVKLPNPEDIASAREWTIGAVLYKPGSGWYGRWAKPSIDGAQVFPDWNKMGGRLSIVIQGACIEGNLNRWVNHAMPDGVKVVWNPQACDGLPIVPRSANMFRMKTVSE